MARPSTHIPACPRRPVSTVMYKLPIKYLEALEQNQQIASCCRHPENHDIEAWFSSSEAEATGMPDVYKFICTCGRTHTRFCLGGDHPLLRLYPDRKEYREDRPRWS